MTIIVPFLVFYIIILFLSSKIKKGRNTIFDVLFLLVIVLFSGLRYGIGTDYSVYEGIYDNLSGSIIATDRTGLGFSYFMVFCSKYLGFDFSTFIFIISIITNGIIYYVIRKEGKNPGNSLLLYVSLGFYCFSFNAFRQSLSMALVFLGTHFLKNKKKTKAVISYVIGFLIHSSSLLSIAFSIYCMHSKKKNSNKILTLLLLIALIVIYDVAYTFVMSNLRSYSLYLENASEYAAGIGTFLNVGLFVVLYIITSRGHNLAAEKKQTSLGTVAMGLSMKNWLFARLAYYFTFYYVFTLDEFIDKQRGKRLVVLCYYLGLATYFILNTLFFNEVIPYRSVLW